MFVSAPRGVPHSYTFETDVIRMLVLVAPDGFEEFFQSPQSSKPARALRFRRPKALRTYRRSSPHWSNTV